MNSALYSGLSSTAAHQVRMDVAANNLANVSTVGYKSTRISFQDAFYQTLRGGRPSYEGLGGVTPIQVGTGVSLGAITVMYAQGSLQNTGQPLDAALSGEGMFIVSGPTGIFFTRDGLFGLDDTNTLVMAATGLKVQGWMAQDGVVNTQVPVGDLTFPLQTMRSPNATTAVQMAGNLPAALEDGETVNASVTVYDSLGHRHEMTFEFTKTGTGTWTVTVTCEGVSATDTLTFDEYGVLTSGGTVAFGPAAMPSGAVDLEIEIDLSSVTQFATGVDIAATHQDGYEAAPLQSVTIVDGGLIMGNYPDGRSMPLAQIAVATFPNLGGLERIGNNLYIGTAASGLMQIGEAGSSGLGQIVGGALEMSNTDLTSAFLEMLVTQRAYQAGTRIIATANNLLEEAIRILDR